VTFPVYRSSTKTFWGTAVAQWSDAKKDGGRKTVCRKKTRETSFEMNGRCCNRPEGNEDKAVDGEDER
jgi:hypothetical protein